MKSRQDMRQMTGNDKRRLVKNKAGYEIKINQSKDISNERESINGSNISILTLSLSLKTKLDVPKKEDLKEEPEHKKEQTSATLKEEASPKETHEENANKPQQVGLKVVEKVLISFPFL